MRILIDANVLFPTVLREIVTGYAQAGGFTALWSTRILEEWARAAARIGEETVARAEIAALTDAFPEAEVTPDPEVEAGLSLPDADDIHVLAAAIDGDADSILTQNVRDFPTRTLARHGLIRRAPDEFLLEAWQGDRDRLAPVIAATLARARGFGIEGEDRAILKRARLPRVARACQGGVRDAAPEVSPDR